MTDKPIERWAPATEAELPEQVRALGAYRRAETAEEPVDILRTLRAWWDLLADVARGPLVWQAIARQIGPQALRMNLNTLVRHEVFNASDGAELAKYVVGRLVDADDIRRSRQFPYQFLAAYLNAGDTVPHAIKAGPSDRARDLLWHT